MFGDYGDGLILCKAGFKYHCVYVSLPSVL